MSRDAVREYLTTHDCIEEDLIALRKIKLEGFVNTKNERLFMKLMLARSPSLVKVIVKPAELIEQKSRKKINLKKRSNVSVRLSLVPIQVLITSLVRLRKNNNYIAQNYMNYFNEGRGTDRIFELPRHLIDDILNHMTIKEIARMSVLSRKWNHKWSTHPTILLDRWFHEEIKYRNRSSSSNISDFKNIVNNILLKHSGHIITFVLDISGVGSDDRDIWLRYVSNRGVKELKIKNSTQSTYTLPSFLFNSGELSHLDITNCAFNMPLASTSFQNLVKLDLKKISFDPTLAYTILEAPHLLTMFFTDCNGLQYLNISASRLIGLHIVDSHYVDLKILKAYAELKVLTIASCDKIQQYEFWRRFTLTEIICSFPKLIGFCFNNDLFKTV
ncbi:hypothetical protein RND71_028304 [Anisodus tanguticus]|uniref:F-box domain-containing protein n=1 Tax=Anisodus tanguticus TaxID=243964 RepID=A0AAE1RJJ0_9SOLA|nr:hypothetical protein RND71_028304 [Anisodus tanguticus]